MMKEYYIKIKEFLYHDVRHKQNISALQVCKPEERPDAQLKHPVSHTHMSMSSPGS